MQFTRPAALLSTLVFCAGSAVSLAAEAPPVDKPTASPAQAHQEQPGDAAAKPGKLITTPGMRASRDGFVSIQVNTAAFGDNIVGDAANEPSIAVDPNNPNRIVIAWRQFDTINSNFRQAGYAYSHDGGRTWTFPGVIEPGIFRSDPVLAVDKDGTFYYNSLSADSGLNNFWCHVFRSDDCGVNWDAGTYAFGGDKQWMTIDRTDSPGEGHIYAVWSDYFSSCNGAFTRSTDGGDSYEDCLSIPTDPFWSTLDVNNAGDLYIGGLDWWAGQFMVTRSTNAKFAAQVPSFGQTRYVSLGGSPRSSVGPNPGGLLGQVWLAVDRSDGPTTDNVYLLSSVDPSGGDPLDVKFARSTDGGNTWSSPVRVNDVGTGWQWFGTMSVAPNGRIDVVWNDTRNAGGGYTSETYYAYSMDGGNTWSDGEPLGPPWNPQIGWPNQNKIGDYYHMVSDLVGADLAYSTTYNGEQDVYYLRIGERDCNMNGLGDETEILDGTTDDCNANGIPDSCDIADGTSDDANGNGIPDECETGCEGDLDGDGDTDQADLGELLSAYGLDDGGDLDGDGDTDQADLGILLGDWGCGG
jgi:hypothetical protein